MNLTLTIVNKTKKTNKLYYARDDPRIVKVERLLLFFRWLKTDSKDCFIVYIEKS